MRSMMIAKINRQTVGRYLDSSRLTLFGVSLLVSQISIGGNAVAQTSVYKNPDFGYELEYPGDYIVVDRINVKDQRPLVPQAYQVVVEANKTDRLAAPGTAFFFSKDMMFEISGEEYKRGKNWEGHLSIDGKDYKPYRDLNTVLNYHLEMMKKFNGKTIGDQTSETRYRLVRLKTGEAHEFVTKTVHKGKNVISFKYELLIPIRDKFVVAGFTYRDQATADALQKTLFSICLR